MKYLVLFGALIITLFACKSSKIEESRAPKILYKVNRIDSVKDVYIIYARHSDTIYKILSVKISAGNNCKPILINRSYAFELASLFVRNFNGKYDITPETVDLLTGVDFHGTLINIDEGVKNQRRDLFEAKNIQGLCFVE
jgi:hypothetical protein